MSVQMRLNVKWHIASLNLPILFYDSPTFWFFFLENLICDLYPISDTIDWKFYDTYLLMNS